MLPAKLRWENVPFAKLLTPKLRASKPLRPGQPSVRAELSMVLDPDCRPRIEPAEPNNMALLKAMLVSASHFSKGLSGILEYESIGSYLDGRVSPVGGDSIHICPHFLETLEKLSVSLDRLADRIVNDELLPDD